MTSYKVHYFDYRARAEAIRFLLSYGGIEFEDVRFKDEDWPNFKPSMPFGKVPVLEIDGVKYSHTISICSYLGKKFNLAGSNDVENMQIETVALFVYDMIGIAEDLTFNYKDAFGDESFKKQLDKLINEIIPTYLKQFDDIVAKNNGYLALGQLTWADLYFVSFAEYFQGMFDFSGLKLDGNFIEKYENLKNLRDKVLAIESIKKWVDKRPETIA